MEPASIRTKNPGAMWPGPIATKWGSKEFISLNDGTGQGNKIAIFATYVQGICAQMDLWRSSPKYKDQKFGDAIAVWSGHNNVPSYIAYVKARVPGITESTVMNEAFWHGPMAIPFLKAQAGHEAGKVYPAPDGDWVEAQAKVLGTVVVPAAPAPVKTPLFYTSSGIDVETVQQKLGIEVDGQFGKLTARAVVAFQITHDLPVHGIVDAATWAVLNK